MGLMLRKVSSKGDLVVTMSRLVGDNTAIYYSRRRGLKFQPHVANDWWYQLPAEEYKSIRLFNIFRTKNAKWLAIADNRKYDIWKNHKEFARHIERNTTLVVQTKDFSVCT